MPARRRKAPVKKVHTAARKQVLPVRKALPQEDRRRDFDYIVTPFPEAIGKILIPGNPYVFWVLISLIIMVVRVCSMILCGEEYGRYAINIVYSLLPGISACLIIFYSKQTENTTRIIRNIVKGHEEKTVIKAYEELIKKAFNDRAMILCGILFMIPFSMVLKEQQLYPTPSHNITHRAKVRDKITVNVGKSWSDPTKGKTAQANATEMKDENANDTNKPKGQVDKMTTWGWVQLPLGKVIRLANEENREMYQVLTRTPQETYDTHPPQANHDEDLRRLVDSNILTEDELNRIDPYWNKLYKKSVELTADEKKEERAKKLLPPLKNIYLNNNAAQLWEISQYTFMMVMLPLLFFSGALLWCLWGIIKISWCLGRKPRKKDKQCIWSDIEVDTFPHPSKSISAVGRLLWRVAFISGSIYSLIMVCQFFARPNTMSLAIASMFSLVVVALFIIPQFNLHELMVRAKYEKIGKLDAELSSALEEASNNPNTKNLQRAKEVLDLQKALSEASEWPCDLKSLAMVLGSVIIPVFMAIFTLYDHFQ